MDFGNLQSREIRKLEDDTLATIEKWKEHFPTGLPSCGPTRLDSGFSPSVSLEQILENEHKYYVFKLQQIYERYRIQEGEQHYWVGINPPIDSISLDKLYAKMEVCVSKYKFFTHGYLYCLEQHTKGGVRPHIHLMLLTNTKPHRIIETLAKHFGIAQNFIQCKKYKHGLMYHEHIKYIHGDKKEEKLVDVENDRQILEELNIPKYLGKL